MKKPVKVKKADLVGQLWGAMKNLEKRMDMFGSGAAISSAVKKSTREWFCVIGEKASHQYPITRTWHESQDAAEQYAASLVRNQSSTTELIVVKVVSKVGRKEPDIKITRV